MTGAQPTADARASGWPAAVERRSAEPPGTNRGVEITSARQMAFSVHWLTGTTHLPEADVLDLVSRLLNGADFVVLPYGINRYRRSVVTVGGLRVLTEPADPATMPPICVVAPGEACEALGLVGVQELASILKPTRVDLAFDGAPFSPRELLGWVEAGDYRCRSKSWSWHRSRGAREGQTLQLGSRASSWHLCAYDERGWTRMELRLSGERAEQAYSALVGTPEALRSAALGWLREFVDFVDRSADRNVSRCPLLPEWGAFVAGIERLAMHLSGTTAPLLDRTVSWLREQVAPSLAMVELAGVNVRQLVAGGRERLRLRHRAMLAGAGCVPMTAASA